MTPIWPWDLYRAEMFDTIRGQDEHPKARACKYCGAPTRSRYQVCLAHDDLIDLDPGYPAVVDETDVRPHQDPPQSPGPGLAPPLSAGRTSVSSTPEAA